MKVALVALALAVFSQGPQKQKANASEQVPATDQRGTPQAPLTIQFDSAERHAEAEQRKQEREEKAASDAALIRYTKYLAFIAFLQLVVFGYQAAKLRATVERMREGEKLTRQGIDEMRRAADAGSDSAKAAATTAAVTERSLMWTQRAFVFGQRVNSAANIFDGMVKEYLFWVEWENVGATPATDVRSWIRYDAIPVTEKREPAFSAGPSSTQPPTVVGPRAIISSRYRDVPLAILASVWQKQARLFIWSRIEYRDIFMPQTLHHHELCVLVELHQEPSAPRREGQPAASFAPYGPQNSIDSPSVGEEETPGA